MSLTMNSLADLDHPENLNLELQTGKPAYQSPHQIVTLLILLYFQII